MTTILYGGTRQTVEKQLQCTHRWHGPCIDDVSRYYKCTECFVVERDCTEKEFWELTNERDMSRGPNRDPFFRALDDAEKGIDRQGDDMTEKKKPTEFQRAVCSIPGPLAVDMREESALWIAPDDAKALLFNITYHISRAIADCKRLVRSSHAEAARSAWGHLQEAGKDVAFDAVCSQFEESRKEREE